MAFPEHGYVSLERPDLRRLATNDPVGFLARYQDGVILDEIQRAPELPIEVKSGMTIASDAMDGLRWWLAIESNPAVLIHGAGDCYTTQGICVRPRWIG